VVRDARFVYDFDDVCFYVLTVGLRIISDIDTIDIISFSLFLLPCILSTTDVGE